MSRNKAEMKYYGLHACEALFRNRAADIIRVYVTEERMKEAGPLLKWCARNKKAYHVVKAAELEKVAASVHHEGITILAKAPVILDQSQAERQLSQESAPSAIYFFDGVENPHNIGSVARSCAHFGIRMIVGAREKLPAPSPSMYRIAQGACEYVHFAEVSNVREFFRTARSFGYKILATSSHGGRSVFAGTLPEKVIFMLGNEVSGVSPALARDADETVAVPGTGAVESLNVSVCAALLAGEFWRQTRGSAPGGRV
jgi:TrmH RNA methyltransferase